MPSSVVGPAYCNRPGMVTELLLRVFPDLLFISRRRWLLATSRAGWIGSGIEGLYYRDTRLLSRYRLLINGQSPQLDALSAVDLGSTLGYYFCPPAPALGDQRDPLGLAVHELDRQVVVVIWRSLSDGLREEVEITNHGLTPAALNLAWQVEADFADLLEARGGPRQQSAPVARHWDANTGQGGELQLTYQHPQLRRGTIVRWEAGDLVLQSTDTGIRGHVDLGPQESRRLTLTVRPAEPMPRPTAARPGPPRGTGAAGRSQCRLATPNYTVQAAWDRAATDLAALALGEEPFGSQDEGAAAILADAAERAVPAAGLPLYGTLFGRDALTAAGQSLLLAPTLAEGALRRLARHLGRSEDDFYDEQPGRVPQPMRNGPLATLGLTPWLHDYGDYAAPAADLVLLGAITWRPATRNAPASLSSRRAAYGAGYSSAPTGTATASWSTRRAHPKGRSIRAGKTRPLPYATPTAGGPRRLWRPARCRGTGTQRCSSWPKCFSAWASPPARFNCCGMRRPSNAGLTRPSGCPRSSSWPLPWTPPNGR